jgi:hypothetical protein
MEQVFCRDAGVVQTANKLVAFYGIENAIFLHVTHNQRNAIVFNRNIMPIFSGFVLKIHLLFESKGF